MLVPKLKLKLAQTAGLSALLASSGAYAEYGLNLTRGVTPITEEVHDLHMLILWVCFAIGVVVFGAIFYSVLVHRKSKGAVAAQFHESTTVEIIWTVVPFLILVGMAIPATKTLVAMEDVSESDINIKVTGYQWKWGYDYLGEDVSFLSTLSTPREQVTGDAEKGEHYLLEVDNPLVVPINKKVRLSITASDVIHSWWVPKLGGKKDAIPGFVNEMWFKAEKEGTYRGQCAELCGKDHGFMPIVVIAKNDTDYQEWLVSQKSANDADAAAAEKEWSKSDLMARGESVYNTNCAACHQANGQGLPGVFPGLVGSTIATGPKDAHMGIVMNGKSGTAMAAFASQLKDVDLAAVITYERNAWGNDVGDIIQPSEIKAAR